MVTKLWHGLLRYNNIFQQVNQQTIFRFPWDPEKYSPFAKTWGLSIWCRWKINLMMPLLESQIIVILFSILYRRAFNNNALWSKKLGYPLFIKCLIMWAKVWKKVWIITTRCFGWTTVRSYHVIYWGHLTQECNVMYFFLNTV